MTASVDLMEQDKQKVKLKRTKNSKQQTNKHFFLSNLSAL